MGLLGTSMDDPQTAGILALAGQMIRGDMGGGLLGFSQASQAAKQQALQAQLGQLDLQKNQMSMDEMRRKLTDDAAARKVLQDFYARNGSPQSPMPGGAAGMGAPVGQPPAMPGLPGAAPGGGMSTPAAMPAAAPLGTPAMGSTPAANGVTPKAQEWQQYKAMGDALNAQGLAEKAQQYYGLAEKLRPKYGTEPRVVVGPDGKLVNIVVAEDGSTQVLPFGVKPSIKMQDLGGRVVAVDENALTGGQAFNKTQTPDSLASNAVTLRGQNLTDARARDAVKAENMRAGFNADGSVTGDMETTAQAIATGQLPAPSGMALTNPRNQRMLARVMEINPKYDFTDVSAKKKAASDFTTGTLGNSMRSFAVAGQHLDQLGTLVDAMGNHDSQMVNKIGNLYSQQTGSPVVTNFDAAKDVVSKEVVKAIVAGGGGVAEREELSKLMSNANSPAQLKGVIAQYRSLMAAQHDALLQQRRAAGLPDSTLPNYTEANGSGAAAATPNWRFQNGQLVKVN